MNHYSFYLVVQRKVANYKLEGWTVIGAPMAEPQAAEEAAKMYARNDAIANEKATAYGVLCIGIGMEPKIRWSTVPMQSWMNIESREVGL